MASVKGLRQPTEGSIKNNFTKYKTRNIQRVFQPPEETVVELTGITIETNILLEKKNNLPDKEERQIILHPFPKRCRTAPAFLYSF